MSIRDIDLANLSNLSYLDIPPKLEWKFKKSGEISMKDFADHYLRPDIMKDEFDLSNIQDQAKIAALKECQTGAYKDFKIVDYQNNNGGDGFVGFAIETTPGNVIISSRGSEAPDLEKPDLDTKMEDWTDNLKTTIMQETNQQKEAKEFINRVGLMERDGEKYK
ncbi:hypothetical protein [Clostridium gasigenes]|uniref:Uncharacterized protein n=1 Tax=Clostridium gasigenes TaxID=94869 RepID=A0A7X0SID3_9CLOT|nr:hypothetical protein [Clostridium gasigenes]MBB6716888.1 hypothetical protein [Clostridium gasigenes]